MAKFLLAREGREGAPKCAEPCGELVALLRGKTCGFCQVLVAPEVPSLVLEIHGVSRSITEYHGVDMISHVKTCRLPLPTSHARSTARHKYGKGPEISRMCFNRSVSSRTGTRRTRAWLLFRLVDCTHGHRWVATFPAGGLACKKAFQGNLHSRELRGLRGYHAVPRSPPLLIQVASLQKPGCDVGYASQRLLNSSVLFTRKKKPNQILDHRFA